MDVCVCVSVSELLHPLMFSVWVGLRSMISQSNGCRHVELPSGC